MKAIVSVLGVDKTGIIAKVSDTLFKMNINIEDISQTIMQDYFTMIMMIGFDGCAIEDVNDALQKVAKDMDVEINVRHEDIFKSMHRI